MGESLFSPSLNIRPPGQYWDDPWYSQPTPSSSPSEKTKASSSRDSFANKGTDPSSDAGGGGNSAGPGVGQASTDPGPNVGLMNSTTGSILSGQIPTFGQLALSLASAIPGVGPTISGFQTAISLGNAILGATGQQTAQQTLQNLNTPLGLGISATDPTSMLQTDVNNQISAALGLGPGQSLNVSHEAAQALAHSASPAYGNTASPTGFTSMGPSGPGATAFSGVSAGTGPGQVGTTGSLFGGNLSTTGPDMTLSQALSNLASIFSGKGGDDPTAPNAPPGTDPTDPGPNESNNAGSSSAAGVGPGAGGNSGAGAPTGGSGDSGDGPGGSSGGAGSPGSGGSGGEGHKGGPVIRYNQRKPITLKAGADEDKDKRKNVPYMLEEKEFVVNADSAKKNMPLLRRINQQPDSIGNMATNMTKKQQSSKRNVRPPGRR